MRKAAEAADDVAVILSKGQPGLAKTAVQRDRDFLIGQILGMGEGQREEQAQLGIDLRHMAARLGLARDLAGLGAVAYMRGVSRKALRGSWSSRVSSASAPSGVSIQPLDDSRDQLKATNCRQRRRTRS